MNIEQVQLLRKYIRVIEREVDNQLKGQKLCCGISLAQCHALLEVGSQKVCTVSDLATSLNLDKSTLSRTIDNLVKRNLVNRYISETDRRYIEVCLTEEGENMVAGINNFCNKLYATICSHIPENKHELVLEGIDLLSKAILKTRNDEVNK